MDILQLFHLQLQIFILIFIGFLFTKKGIISNSFRNGLTDLVIYLILPANIICSFLIDMDSSFLLYSILIFIISLLLQVFCYFISKVIYFKFNNDQISVLKYATLCSNAGFLGNPVVFEMYGQIGLLLASIFLIPQRIVMWTAGISCFTSKNNGIIKKVITHPCIIAVILGIFLMLLKIELPSFALQTLKSLSQCTTALSMIVIGSILSEISIKTIFSSISIYYTIIRLIIIPIILLFFCKLFNLPYIVTAVSTVLAGMPAGSTTAILAEKYNSDSKLAVRLVFLSTMLSLITIPILSILVSHLF